MYKITVSIAFFLILLILPKIGFSQKFCYDVDLLFFFDNREYHTPYSESQTLFKIRLSPTIGLKLNDKHEGVHKLMAGIHYLQPIGSTYRNLKFFPTIYYHYEYKNINGYFGTIPFVKMLQPIPDYLMCDSVVYDYPNIQGGLIQYQSKHGFVEIQCDWRGQQTKTQREAYRLLLDGEYQYRILKIGGFLVLGHLANKSYPAKKDGVCDELVVNPYIKLDFSTLTPFRSFYIKSGYILSISRERITESTFIKHGAEIELFLNWRFLGVKNTFYVGENLFPLYPNYASLLNRGSPYYQSKLYNRTDLFIYLYRNNFLNCYFSWNFHIVPKYKINHQQQLILCFSLDKMKQDKDLRGVFDK
ncbi:MAG: hypothetical protein LBU83_09410 [Bacteroidales bacterium]|jgi:hypothetical protein|nr:hypothetical protein [Bacteroidales bacterium]